VVTAGGRAVQAFRSETLDVRTPNMAKTSFTPVENCAGSLCRPLLVFDEAARDPVELARCSAIMGSESCRRPPHQMIPPPSHP
jgi:hypothetical protein